MNIININIVNITNVTNLIHISFSKGSIVLNESLLKNCRFLSSG